MDLKEQNRVKWVIKRGIMITGILAGPAFLLGTSKIPDKRNLYFSTPQSPLCYSMNHTIIKKIMEYVFLNIMLSDQIT